MINNLPEKIWISPEDIPQLLHEGLFSDNAPERPWELQDWTRTDLADAAVAAALEGAVAVVEDEGYKARDYPEELVAEAYCCDAAGYIRNSIPTTAEESLEKYAEKVRQEERERCASLIEKFHGSRNTVYDKSRRDAAAAIRGD